MDLFDSFKNLMYKMGDNNIDEFGVDHSNFSLRDELEYNMKVANEKQNNGTNGITKSSFNNNINTESEKKSSYNDFSKYLN